MQSSRHLLTYPIFPMFEHLFQFSWGRQSNDHDQKISVPHDITLISSENVYAFYGYNDMVTKFIITQTLLKLYKIESSITK